MAIEKEIISQNGEKRKYFRISKVNLDYENNTYNIECISYTDKSYRDKEKENLKKYEELKEEYYKLSAKEEKTQSDLARLGELNISDLENAHLNVEPLFLKKETFSINLTEELRDLFYILLKRNENFINAIDVFDNIGQKEENENV